MESQTDNENLESTLEILIFLNLIRNDSSKRIKQIKNHHHRRCFHHHYRHNHHRRRRRYRSELQ